MRAPEKDFFTIPEILERWRYAGIDEATLLKYAIDDILVFSVYITDLGSHQTSRDTPEGRVTTKHTVEFSFRADGYHRPALQYLKGNDARRLLEARQGEMIAVRGHYSLPSRTKESGMGHVSAPLFSHSDLLISSVERHRFEKQYKLQLRPPLLVRAWRWLADQANQRALTMLAGWVVAAVAAAWAAWVWWYEVRTRPPARPNTSVEARPNGKAPWPPTGFAYHPSGGQGALPSVPPHLER